jgi:methylmalonyl-CoA/ethylmalonyl-CoA epimerase
MTSDTFCVGLHHVGFLTGDLEGTSQHFNSVLGYKIESRVVEDSLQTARVQFLRQPGGTSWLELVTPNGEGGKLANALKQGDGLHHLCYEVTDLESACSAYRDRGCLMVGSPTPAVAFDGRRIAWFMDRRRFLFELVEAGLPPLSLASILSKPE